MPPSYLILTLLFASKWCNGIRIRADVAINDTNASISEFGMMETTNLDTYIPVETRLDLIDGKETNDTYHSDCYDFFMLVVVGATVILLMVIIVAVSRYYAYSQKRKKQWDLEQEKSRKIALERMDKLDQKKPSLRSISPSASMDESSASKESKSSQHGSISSASSMSFESDCQLTVF